MGLYPGYLSTSYACLIFVATQRVVEFIVRMVMNNWISSSFNMTVIVTYTYVMLICSQNQQRWFHSTPVAWINFTADKYIHSCTVHLDTIKVIYLPTDAQ